MVGAFHTISGEALQDLEHEMESDVLVCGTDTEAKAVVGGLIEEIPSLRWVDAGDLTQARIAETLTALLISINRTYKIQRRRRCGSRDAMRGGSPGRARRPRLADARAAVAERLARALSRARRAGPRAGRSVRPATGISVTTPARGAGIAFSIFIASRMQTTSPAWISWPGSTSTRRIVPCIGAAITLWTWSPPCAE